MRYCNLLNRCLLTRNTHTSSFMSISKTGRVLAFMETMMVERDAWLEGTMEAERKILSVDLD